MEAESAGLVGTLGAAIGMGITYAVKILGAKINGGTVGAANDSVQKDMLQFLKDQLESEVERREKVELAHEQLYVKFNELSKQMGIIEIQNQRLQQQVSELSDLVASLKGNPR